MAGGERAPSRQPAASFPLSARRLSGSPVPASRRMEPVASPPGGAMRRGGGSSCAYASPREKRSRFSGEVRARLRVGEGGDFSAPFLPPAVRGRSLQPACGLVLSPRFRRDLCRACEARKRRGVVLSAAGVRRSTKASLKAPSLPAASLFSPLLG